ncbi:pantetheine-phosphate adenylyltransferase [Kineococcus gynurae]|uniref:Phosphopantetheine adenylyltransferase n=1 Tax=Kineococcus gynurae TaxID=452979 RepID=A0ABV5LVP3_9ACTN
MPVERGPRRAVCPGSFDPLTLGHLDVLLRAADLVDEVHVAVAANPAKSSLFTAEERVALVREVLAGTEDPRAGRVRVAPMTAGLLVEHCREVGAGMIVKGLRSSTDYAYEVPMALMNRDLSGVETVFVVGDPRYGHVSSSLVKEVARHGGGIAHAVPSLVERALRERLGR